MVLLWDLNDRQGEEQIDVGKALFVVRAKNKDKKKMMMSSQTKEIDAHRD